MGGDGAGSGLAHRLVGDDLWATAAPLLPSFNSRPQGGGTAPTDARTVFTAVVFVVSSGCAWRQVPQSFGISHATAHRHFRAWTAAGVWPRLRQTMLADGNSCDLDWVLDIVSAALARAESARR